MHRLYWRQWDLELIGSGRAFEETSYVLPRQGLALDAGWGRTSVFAQPVMFLSHLHLDHAMGLPRYAVNRHKMGDGSCRILVHAEALDAAREVVAATQRAEGRTDDIDWVGVEPGDTVALNGNWRLDTFASIHGVPTLGCILKHRESRVKPEFEGQPPAEIGRLVRAGAEPVEERWVPVFAYCGDTEIGVLDRVPELYDAKVLLLESTFVEALHDDPIRVRGHVHWEEICARAERFSNEALVLTHFSRRYPADVLWYHLNETCPAVLRPKLRPLISIDGTDVRQD